MWVNRRVLPVSRLSGEATVVNGLRGAGEKRGAAEAPVKPRGAAVTTLARGELKSSPTEQLENGRGRPIGGGNPGVESGTSRPLAERVAARTGLEIPEADWSMERLTKYIQEGFGESARLGSEALRAFSRATERLYWVGCALAVIKPKLKRQYGWGRWCREQGWSETTAWETIELFNRAGSPEEIAQMSISEAKVLLGITKPKQLASEEITPKFAQEEPRQRESVEAKIAAVRPVAAAEPARRDVEAHVDATVSLKRILASLGELEGCVTTDHLPLIEEAQEILAQLRVEAGW